MRKFLRLLLAFTPVFFLCNAANAQLAEFFARMKSADPAVREAARNSTEQEIRAMLPHIDQEIPAIREGLSDSDASVRNEAAALLSFLAYTPLFGNRYAAILTSCLPNLIIAAEDKDADVADKALRAIATMPGGPPRATFAVLTRALDGPSSERKSLAVLGLTTSPDYTSEIGSRITTQLHSATQSDTKLALLRGLMPSGSDEVADAAAAYAYDRDPEVRTLAIEAIPNIYVDRSRAQLRLQQYVDSTETDLALKEKAQEYLKILETRPK